MQSSLRHRFSIAPMLDCTDRHYRYLARLLTRHALLYTEMITTPALLHGNRARLLDFSNEEHPLALQLGGSDPQSLAQCAAIAQDWGYDEVNLNAGCPSDRVKKGRFGACLMKEPELVAESVHAMCSTTRLPITVKTRIGVDWEDSYEFLCRFVSTVAQAGCRTFIIHARKAWLSGLSPKENREIPPLNYDRVFQLKRDFPDLNLVLNGGLVTLEQSQSCLTQLDGVMMGRAAYHTPYLLADVDRLFYYDDHPVPNRMEIMESYLVYMAQQLESGTPLNIMARPVLGLFHGEPGARLWRRHLSENMHRSGATLELMQEALGYLTLNNHSEHFKTNAHLTG